MRYVALFRGINVSGKNTIRMKDLAEFFNKMGFSHVRTYIQSGNVIFDSDTDVTEEQIQGALLRHLGKDVSVMLRTKEDMSAIVDGFPFSPQECDLNDGIEHNYVLFLKQMDQKHVDMVNRYNGPDILRLGKREIYMRCEGSIRDSKAASSFIKDLSVTARNWNTVCKLRSMIEEP